MSGQLTVDDYIGQFPPEIRVRLAQLRDCVVQAAPGATEKISYGMPTYHCGRNLFHFAAFAGHIGLYPGPAAIQAHAAQLELFKTSKGAIRIPHAAPLPLDLVTRLVDFNLRHIPASGISTKAGG